MKITKKQFEQIDLSTLSAKIKDGLYLLYVEGRDRQAILNELGINKDSFMKGINHFLVSYTRVEDIELTEEDFHLPGVSEKNIQITKAVVLKKRRLNDVANEFALTYPRVAEIKKVVLAKIARRILETGLVAKSHVLPAQLHGVIDEVSQLLSHKTSKDRDLLVKELSLKITKIIEKHTV